MTAPTTHYADRVETADWDRINAELDDIGCALIGPLLDRSEALSIAQLYAHDKIFRSTVDMGRYRFGQGEYRYFARPLPDPIEELRASLYRKLLPIARSWWTKLGREHAWPDDLTEWLEMCHHAGQRKPTAILLRYRQGDWNALHRDLYGDLLFPLQVVVSLSEPMVDYTGGEFLLVEQRPRAQSRGTSVTIPRGHGLVFTTQDRPVPTRRGWSAAPIRHGVSIVRAGERLTLGLVFHDAA